MCQRNWLRVWNQGGLGTHIIRDVMDHVSYNQTPLGNRFVAVKNLRKIKVNISVRDVGNAKVVEVAGDVDLGTSPQLRSTLFEMLNSGAKLALNLAAIRYIDSSGIATLIEVLKDSHHLNKEFVLFGLSPAVLRVFQLTHVIRIFRVCQTEQEALGIT